MNSKLILFLIVALLTAAFSVPSNGEVLEENEAEMFYSASIVSGTLVIETDTIVLFMPQIVPKELVNVVAYDMQVDNFVLTYDLSEVDSCNAYLNFDGQQINFIPKQAGSLEINRLAVLQVVECNGMIIRAIPG